MCGVRNIYPSYIVRKFWVQSEPRVRKPPAVELDEIFGGAEAQRLG